jgi:hypothetical protein
MYELVFGYLNRNPETVEIPVGPDNSVQPGGPDRGQPTTFLPGRQRIMFRIPVAIDFNGKVVWTLNYAELTQLATASIARSSAPGTYLLRVVAVERTSSNALMTVTVTP